MSIIQTLQRRIESLEAENIRLKREKEETEKDMFLVATKTKEAWEYLDLDFSKMKQSNDEKPSFLEITKLSTNIIRKMTSGKIKISVLIEKWDALEPTLVKYQHVLKKD